MMFFASAFRNVAMSEGAMVRQLRFLPNFQKNFNIFGHAESGRLQRDLHHVFDQMIGASSAVAAGAYDKVKTTELGTINIIHRC